MRWSEEKYVKFYTRKTVTWHSWPWQSKALFPLLLQSVDGAGLLELGGIGEVRAVAMVTCLPEDVVKAGIEGLVASETVLRVADGLLMPKYLEAQEATKSDKQKKQDQRERAVAKARLGILPESGTLVSPAVTDGHPLSPAVPLQPSPAQPSPAQKEDLSTSSTVVEVFEHWRERVSPKAKLDEKRRKLIKARLEHYPPDELKQAIDGYVKSPWHQGANERHQKFLDLGLMLRDAEHVDRGLQLADGPTTGPPRDITRGMAGDKQTYTDAPGRVEAP